MVSKLFLEKLLLKLKTGNSRSIHLNALPGRFARLDLYDLINIDQSLHLDFLRKLLTKSKFEFTISIDFKNYDEQDEQLQMVRQIIKKLDSLHYQYQDEFLEHGTQTFALGYPLLIKRDAVQSSKILKAPLITWYLDIQKDLHKANTWHISRNEDQPIIFNEVLRSHIETHDKIKFENIFSQAEDQVITEEELTEICHRCLEKLGTTPTDTDSELKILPGTNRETIEKLTADDPWIRWSGIFGLYKTQKQSIIRDIESLIAEPAILSSEAQQSINDDPDNFSAVPLDPSQERILHGLDQYGKIIIQGPPGTGKSQSLTAIISDSLYNGSTCLVVCEKKTALDVIYQNLADLGLADYCIVIDDVHRNRKMVVDKVRRLLETREDPPFEFRHHEYGRLADQFKSLKTALGNRISSLNVKCFGDDSLMGMIAQIRHQKNSLAWQALTFEEDIPFPVFSYDEFIQVRTDIQEGIKLHRELPQSLSFDKIGDQHFIDELVGQRLFPDTLSMLDHIQRINAVFDDDLNSRSKLFNPQTAFNNLKLKIGSIFMPGYRHVKAAREFIVSEYRVLWEYLDEREYFKNPLTALAPPANMDVIKPALGQLKNQLDQFHGQREYFDTYHKWRSFLIGRKPLSRTILTRLSQTIPPDKWLASFDIWYKSDFIQHQYQTDHTIEGDMEHVVNDLQITDEELMAQIPGKIKSIWDEKQKALYRKRTISGIKHLYNYRRNKSYGKRNSLRKIVHQDLELFTTSFPVIMVNPSVCSSVLPLESNIFDCVIFDEASQLRIEDTFPALIRGNNKIISGDKHQMPPTSYFMSNVVLMEDTDSAGAESDLTMEESVQDDFLAESQSLLEYGMDTDYHPEYLDFHYRSRHPDLIAFSNAAFYGNRLVPMPPRQTENAIEFFQVDGTYTKGRINPDEAQAIVQYIFDSVSNEGHFPSVGIATFNINQRNYIWDLLMKETYANEAFSQKLDQLIEKGLFVKNLENIQGDERDVILISTTFGPDTSGKFKQLFGPITQSKGYQLLNVIISRAKRKVVVFTSVPQTYRAQFKTAVEEKGNTGKAVFYSYLAYAESVANQQLVRQANILDLAAFHCHEKPFSHELKSMPLFLQLIYSSLLEKYGQSAIAHNYRYGGFILETVYLKNGMPAIALMTSYIQNPAETSYRMFLFKQKILQEHQIKTYIIDAMEWFRDWDASEAKLHRFIDA